MSWRELLLLCLSSVLAQRTRSLLTGVGIAIGIMAVILLTSIGKGMHHYVVAEFSQFGTNLVAIQPGKTMTMGAGNVGVFGSVRPLSIADAEALRRIAGALHVNASVNGNAELRANGKTRRTAVYGASADFVSAFNFKVQSGRFLPADDPEQARAFVVLGAKVAATLFAGQNPLGRYLRVGGQRFRVIGVMESKGQILGMDFDDAVMIPAARALGLFNRSGLMEVQLSYAPHLSASRVEDSVKALLSARHGQEDFTVISQEQALSVLNSVLEVLTFAVGALGSISLLVGGVGILTIMTMAVRERTTEIGLLRALGATQRQVLQAFLLEAVLLSLVGGLVGLLAGLGLAYSIHLLLPALPVQTSWLFVGLALAISMLIGLLAGALPAWRAARMDPVSALQAE